MLLDIFLDKDYIPPQSGFITDSDEYQIDDVASAIYISDDDNDDVLSDSTITDSDCEKSKEQQKLASLLYAKDFGNIPPEKRLSTPKLLKTPLLEYQKIGLQWMIDRERKGCRGGILADEQGLGKTMQSIALIFQDDHIGARTTLVVCPANLTAQWKAEIKSNVTSAKVLNYHQDRKNGLKLQKCDVVITSYDRIVTEYKKFKKNHKDKRIALRESPLFSFVWTRIILDEAHLIRNRTTKKCKSVKHLEAHRRWCLTGTPIQNKVGDVFGYLQFLNIIEWKSYSYFSRKIEQPFRRGTGRNSAIRRLQMLFREYCLRRTKTDTLDGVPIFKSAGKTHLTHPCVFSEEERDFYNHLERETHLKFKRFARCDSIQRHADILALITQLRQAACHPALAQTTTDYARKRKPLIKKTKSSDDSSHDSSDEDSTPRKKRIKTIDIDLSSGSDGSDIERPIGAPAMIDLTPEISVEENSSCKIDMVLQLLREIDPLEKVIIYSSFTRFLDIINNFLHDDGIEPLYYTGVVPIKERPKVLEKFDNGPHRVILMSLQCGSLGLNMTCATQVILMDPWWNPAVEAQAGDRVDRIGQDKPITIHKLYVSESIESRILELQAAKKELMSLVLSPDNWAPIEPQFTIEDYEKLIGIKPM